MKRKVYLALRGILAAFILIGVLVTLLFDHLVWGLVVFGLGFAMIAIVNLKYKKAKQEGGEDT
jgi:hypothetical protein